MAKEDQPTIGINKSTMTMIVLILTVFGGLAFWKDRGGTEAAAAATHNSMVSSHETRITGVEHDISVVKERQTSIEKTQIALQKDQQAILSGQQEMKVKQTKLVDMMMKKIESDAEIKAWIKSIDKVD